MAFVKKWFSIDSRNMMRQDYTDFLSDLQPYTTQVKTYSRNKRIYVRASTDTGTWSNPNLQHKLSGWVYYHPVNLLYKKPKKLSDYDEIR